MSLKLRDLELTDYKKGYINLLQQLTAAGMISEEAYAERFKQLHDSPDYRILIIEDTEEEKVVATATLFVERKFIHACGKARYADWAANLWDGQAKCVRPHLLLQVGHIEDVVVDRSHRGHHLGQRILEALKIAAREAGCYKVILDCAESNAAFYEKCGLVRRELQMVIYF